MAIDWEKDVDSALAMRRYSDSSWAKKASVWAASA